MGDKERAAALYKRLAFSCMPDYRDTIIRETSAEFALVRIEAFEDVARICLDVINGTRYKNKISVIGANEVLMEIRALIEKKRRQ